MLPKYHCSLILLSTDVAGRSVFRRCHLQYEQSLLSVSEVFSVFDTRRARWLSKYFHTSEGSFQCSELIVPKNSDTAEYSYKIQIDALECMYCIDSFVSVSHSRFIVYKVQ